MGSGKSIATMRAVNQPIESGKVLDPRECDVVTLLRDIVPESDILGWLTLRCDSDGKIVISEITDLSIQGKGKTLKKALIDFQVKYWLSRDEIGRFGHHSGQVDWFDVMAENKGG